MVDLGGYELPIWLCLALPLLVCLYRYLTPSDEYFKTLGIPYLKPWPLFGNKLGVFSQGFTKHGEELGKLGKIVGMFDGKKPTLMVHDLDLLKEVLVKRFQHFQNHKNVGLTEYPMRKMMNQIEFDHWKHVRNQLTPTFSGGKLRRMNETVNRCARQMVSHLEKVATNKEVIELKKEAGNFTMDVIAGTAFGIDIDCHESGDSDFEVYMGKVVKSFTGLSLRIVIFLFFPWLVKPLKMSFFPKETMDFFIGVINQSLGKRGEDETNAKDFLQLMVNAHVDDPKEEHLVGNEDLVKTKEGWIYSKKGLTHEEILAQSFLFFLAGYDTTAIQLSFLCYNLACHPEVQDKLYQEIVVAMGDLKEPTYDVIKNMPYLQMCIEETSRVYPSAARTDRICNDDVVINGLDIRKGTRIVIPIWSIHHDPEIYPEPDKFIPERFSEESKAERHPMAWMPFGQGPRNCVGMRLALMEIKFAIIHLLLRFRIVTCAETEIPVKLEKMRMVAVNGIKVKVENRE